MAPADCAQLAQSLKDQEDRYWKIYKEELAGHHLAEGRKIDPLRWQLRQCAARPNPVAISELSAAMPAAHSGHRDHSDRLIVITPIGMRSQGVGSVGDFVLTKRDGEWTVTEVSWRAYESPGQ